MFRRHYIPQCGYRKRKGPVWGLFLLLHLLVELVSAGGWVEHLELKLSGDLLLVLGRKANMPRRRLHFLQAVL